MRDSIQNDDFTNLLIFLWKWRRVVLFSALGTAILVVIISSPIVTKPQYEAETILFAAKNNSSERQLADLEFGYDVEADRLIQVLLSNSLRDSIVRKFDLVHRYVVDTSKKFGMERVKKIYTDRINFERTQYMSVVVKVKDEDANIAAEIANSIPGMAERIRTSILKQNAKLALENSDKEYKQKLNRVRELRDSMDIVKRMNANTALGKLENHYQEKVNKMETLGAELSRLRKQNNIYDYGEQVNILNRQLSLAKSSYQLESGKLPVLEKSYSEKDTILINSRARLEGASKQMKEIQANLDQLSAINKIYLSLTSDLQSEEAVLNQVKPAYEDAKYAFEPIVQSSLYNSLQITYSEEINPLNNLFEKYERARQAYSEPVSGVYVVSRAEPDLLKKSPSISLNGIIGFLIGGMASIIIILVSEKFKQIKRKMNDRENEQNLLDSINIPQLRSKTHESTKA